MPRITNAFIEQLSPPEQGQIIYRDDLLRGFGLRLTRNCKAFIVEGNVKGKRIRTTIGHYRLLKVQEARLKAKQVLQDMARGISPRDRRNAPSLEEVLNHFLVEVDLKEETKRGFRRIVRRELADWLLLPITAITKEMIQKRHRDLIRPTRCNTDNKTGANSSLSSLRRLINFARVNYEVDGKPILVENTVSNALHWRWYRANIRQGTIPDQKLALFYRLLMEQNSKIARDYILFVLFTGLRRTEAKSIQWQNVDFDNRQITIPATNNKSNREHMLPLTPILEAILLSRRKTAEGPFVFPGRDRGCLNEPRAVLAKMRERMGWQWLVHDLRRTALSAGEKAGVPFLALQRIANHKVRRDTTDRYIILDVEYLRPYMEMMNQRLLDLMGASIEDWKKLEGQIEEYRPHFGKNQAGQHSTEPEEEEEFYW